MSENASEIKLCKDCKHSPIWLIGGNVGCAHPGNGIDVTTGRTKTVFAIANRTGTGKCGFHAENYEEREYLPEKESFWSIITRKFTEWRIRCW